MALDLNSGGASYLAAAGPITASVEAVAASIGLVVAILLALETIIG
jgi:hypothetical protein